MRLTVVALPLCGLLGGCAVAAKMDARTDYQASASAYKACLAANAPQACESQRLAMEVDERKYNNLSAGIDPGGNRSATLTVINR